MEHISNHALKELLLQYNITNDDIKGTGRHGRVLKQDRYKIYQSLQDLPILPSEVVSIITKDLDLPVARLINKQYKEDKNKEFVFQFVKQHINEAIRKRIVDYNWKLFKSKKEFIDHQWQVISSLDKEDVLFYLKLIKKIKVKQVRSSSTDFREYTPAEGFVFVNDIMILVPYDY